jgi:transcriptional regulator with XRE-family HTH domain
MNEIYREVGERIRAKRLRLGMTLEDLSELTGLHASYIGQIERNTKKASLETVAIMAKALGVPVGRLFSDATLSPKAHYSEQLTLILRLAGDKKKALLLDILRRLAQGLRELN